MKSTFRFSPRLAGHVAAEFWTGFTRLTGFLKGRLDRSYMKNMRENPELDLTFFM